MEFIPVHSDAKTYAGYAPDGWVGFNDDPIDVSADGKYLTYQVRVFRPSHVSAFRGDDLFFYNWNTGEKTYLGGHGIDRPGGSRTGEPEKNDQRIWFEGDLIKVLRYDSSYIYDEIVYYDPVTGEEVVLEE